MVLVVRCSNCGAVLYKEEVVYEKRYTRKGRYVGTEPKKVFYVPDKVVEALGTTVTRIYCGDPSVIFALERCPYCGSLFEGKPRRIKISPKSGDNR